MTRRPCTTSVLRAGTLRAVVHGAALATLATLATLAVVAAPAAAQEGGEGASPFAEGEAEPAPAQPVPPPPAPAPAPAPAPGPAPAHTPAADSDDNRPQDPWALGLGAGWNFPTDLLTPNTASARFLFPGRLTVEPFLSVVYGLQNNTNAFTSPVPNASFDNEQTNQSVSIGAGAGVRVPFARRGNLDLQVLGSVGVAHTIAWPDLGDDAEGEVHNTNASLSYGLGIEWFLIKNLALSVDALNPIATVFRQATEVRRDITFIDPNTGNERRGSTVSTETATGLSVGAIFNPTIRLMLHLYF